MLSLPSIIIFLLIAILFYTFYSLIKKAFEEVGFTGWESSIIVFGSIILGMINLPLFKYNGWIIGINLGGALLPIIISIYLMVKNKVFFRVIIGIALVSYITYNFTYVSNRGIVSPFPLWLLPPIAASMYSVMVSIKSKRKAASIAYSSGTMGALIGADFLHLKELLSLRPHAGAMAVIGGASILDMVFLTGVIAVIVDALLYES